MRLQELPRKIQRVLAEVALEQFSSESFIRFADCLLNEGIWSDHLGIIHSSNGRFNTVELHLLFNKALQELAIEPLDADRAVELCLEIDIAALAESHEQTIELLMQLLPHPWISVLEKHYYPVMKRLGCWQFEDWYWGVEEWIGQEEFQGAQEELITIACQARDFSAAWTRQRFRSRIEPSWFEWRDGTIVKLAENIQRQAAYAHLPILADALEEAGCTDRALLDHCRERAAHHHYCWVADLFLPTSAS